jgi:hypothetical protein
VELSEEPPLFGRFTTRIEPMLPIGGELNGVNLIRNLKILALAGDITLCYGVCSLFYIPDSDIRNRELDSAEKGKEKTEAFELWTWRRILQVPWTEKRTNLSVLENVKPKRSLEATILLLKLHYFGHVMRAKRSLERDIMLEQAAGHRKQGKPRMRWLDSIKEATGLRLEDLREAVQDRKNWRTLVEEKTRNRERTNVK